MDPGERGIELLPHLCERQRQCSAPTDQHIIMTVAHLAFGREPDHLPQSPPHSIALYRVADLPRHRKTDPCHTVVAARSRLQHESTGGRPLAPRRSAEVGAAGQPIHRLRMEGTSPITRSAACARAPGALPALCDRLWLPCGRESRGGACAPICSADKSVSRDGLRFRDWRGLYGSPFGPSNATRPPVAAVSLTSAKANRYGLRRACGSKAPVAREQRAAKGRKTLTIGRSGDIRAGSGQGAPAPLPRQRGAIA